MHVMLPVDECFKFCEEFLFFPLLRNTISKWQSCKLKAPKYLNSMWWVFMPTNLLDKKHLIC